MVTTANKRDELILRGRDRVLQSISTGSPVATVLRELADFAEEVLPESHTSVLLLDGSVLRHCAAPSLPPDYVQLIDGIEIGMGIGSCGEAAFTGRRVITENVLRSPNWTAFGDAIEIGGFRACWSEPILSSTQQVMGTFAIYHDEPRTPDEFELQFIRSAAQVAGLALTIRRAQDAVQESEERFRQLAENIHEVFWLTDWETNHVLYVSPTYKQIWGHPPERLYANPSSWSEAIHSEDRQRVYDLFVAEAANGNYDTEYRIIDGDGALRWIHDRAFPIRNADGKVYRICGISADITERKIADLRSLESLTTELLLAEERERRNLAEDLHDGPNQTLTLAQMTIDTALHKAPEELRPELSRVAQLIKEANQATRSLTFQLSPPILHDFGFEAAVEWLVEDVQKTYGVSVTLDQDRETTPLDERVRMLLFRAVRELLINVAKHAEASRANVVLRREAGFLVVTVSDDGVASDPSKLKSGRGLGLRTIRERLARLGGRMEIASASTRGTTIMLYAPLLEPTA